MSIQAQPRMRDADVCVPASTGGVLPGEDAKQCASIFKALSDPVRLRLLRLIGSGTDGEVCVCELTDSFDLSAPTISYHLKALRQAGLIAGERRGTWIYYRLVPEALDHAGALLAGIPVVAE